MGLIENINLVHLRENFFFFFIVTENINVVNYSTWFSVEFIFSGSILFLLLLVVNFDVWRDAIHKDNLTKTNHCKVRIMFIRLSQSTMITNDNVKCNENAS